jgi:hypothetical protein
MAPVQREGVEYEFTVLLDIDKSGSVLVQKSRCSAVEERGSTIRREDLGEVADMLKAWLESGAEAPPPAPAPKPAPTPQPAPVTQLAPAAFRGQRDSDRAADAAADASFKAMLAREAANPKPPAPPVDPAQEIAAALAEIQRSPDMRSLSATGTRLIKTPHWKDAGLKEAFTLRQRQLTEALHAEGARRQA